MPNILNPSFIQSIGGEKMQTIHWNKFLKYFLIGLIALGFAISSCAKKEEEDTSATPDPEAGTTFTAENKTTLSNSLIELPASLQGGADASGNANIVYNGPNYAGGGGGQPDRCQGEDGFTGMYCGVTHYVRMAEMFKDLAKELMGHIVGSSLLKTAVLGELIALPEDPTDPGSPKYVKVEKPDTADYKWKVSLYFTTDTTSPDMIIRFKIVSGKAKGRIVWTMSEEDEDLALAGFTGINITRSVDVVFDATGTNKTLDIKFVQDLTNLWNRGKDEWATLTQDEKRNFDMGQPSKVFVTASYDGTEHTIYGTSYHPGWAFKSSIPGEQDESPFGATRTMYMFAAKSKTDSNGVEGASLNLALPEETRTDVTGVWTDDSLGALFKNMMHSQLQGLVDKLADGNDDPDPSNDSVTVEKQNALGILNHVFREQLPAITNVAAYAQDITTDDITAAESFWVSNGDILNGVFGNPDASVDAANLNVYLGPTLDTSSDSDIYNIIKAPEIIAGYNAGNKPDIEDFIAFIFADASGDSEKQAQQEQYKTVKSLVNPAFFNANSGFIGTLDSSNDIYYEWKLNQAGNAYILDATTDQSAISELKTLDLTTIISHVPATVKAATITVE